MKCKKIFLICMLMFFLAAGISYSDGSCCIITNEGTPCINSPDGQPVSNCATFLAGECSEHNECTTSGACILFEDNVCNEGVSEERCLSIGGEPHVNRECSELGGFQDVCCRVGVEGFSSYRFIPENECTNLESEVFEHDEVECSRQNEVNADRKGCCVNADQSCNYGFESSCEEGIFQPFFCSVLESQCDPICESHASIGPGPVRLEMQYDLYYLDSCENPEEIYIECDDLREMPVINEDSGQWECGSARCNSVWDNPYTDENHDSILENDDQFSFGGSSRTFRFNGESWCEYQQAKVGPALDLPGTQHYMHTCIFGEEKVIPSEGEGRGKICVEKMVEAAGYTMTQAEWLDNIPDRCLVCNTVENTEQCCSARVQQGAACSYVQRVDLTGNTEDIDLFVDQNSYNNLQDVLSGQINNVIGLHDLYVDSASVAYYIDGSEAGRTNVIGDRGLAENVCDDETGFCLVRIFEVPVVPGTYSINVEYRGHICWLGTGRWCGSDRCCGRDDESGSISLGQHTFNFDTSGVCVPLVPPSTNALCNQFPEISDVVNSEGETASYLEFNYYFDFPFASLGQFGTCDSTEQCRQRLFETFSYSTSGSLIADDLNNLCRSLGDCGISHNLAGTDTLEGFEMSDVCPAWISRDESTGECLVSEQIYPTVRAGEFQALSQGSPIRPEDSLPVIFFLPFSFRRKIKKNFYLILFLSLFVLAGCSGEINYDRLPSVAQCNEWQPPTTTNDCWRCSAGWDEERNGVRGLLPAADFKTTDDKPAYRCTQYLCESLGNCNFIEGIEDEEGPDCVPHEPDIVRVPKIVIEGTPAYTCNIFEGAGCNEGSYQINNERNVIINGKLEPFLPLEIRFKTVDVNDPLVELATECEFDDNSAMSSQEDLPFPDSGRADINHILKIVNHAPRDDNYKYYIRCTSIDGEITPQPYATVEFSVGVQGYTTPIIRSAIPESGSAYVRHGVSTKNVVLNVVGDVVECRWGNQKISFGEMADTRIVSREIIDGVEDVHTETVSNNGFGCSIRGDDGTRRCSASLGGIVEGENKFWFSCAGRVQECDERLRGVSEERVEEYLECTGSQQQCNSIINNRVSDVNNYLNCLREGGEASNPWPEDGYLVTGTSALNISNIKCMHSLGEDCGTIYDNSFDVAVETIGGAQNGNAACRWALAEYDFDAFDEPGGTRLGPNFAATHIERDISRSTGEYNLRFRCEDIAGNTDEKEITVNLERDDIPPKIIKVYRVGDELNIETNEVTACSYLNEISTNFADAELLSTSDGLNHKIMITNNFYRVRCTDRFDNFRQTDVYT